MKKLFVLVLALSLVACLALSASADTIGTATGSVNGSATINLDASVGGGADGTETVYSVDVEWTETAFTYIYVGASTNDVLTWNPATHQYEVINSTVNAGESDWDDATATVNVTNHSNAAVTATLTVAEPANDAGTVTFAVTGGDDNGASKALADASVIAYQNPGAADKVTFTVTADGVPAKSFSVAMTVALSAN